RAVGHRISEGVSSFETRSGVVLKTAVTGVRSNLTTLGTRSGKGRATVACERSDCQARVGAWATRRIGITVITQQIGCAVRNCYADVADAAVTIGHCNWL